MSAYVLGIDPALNFGWCIAEITHDSFRPVSLGSVLTESKKKKLRILQADDDDRRIREIWKPVVFHAAHYNVVAICAELPHGAKSARAATALGIAKGITTCISLHLDLALSITNPKALKKAVTGRANASKDDVRSSLETMFPAVCQLWPTDSKGRILEGQTEHAADALGAIVACADSQAITTARKMMT